MRTRRDDVGGRDVTMALDDDGSGTNPDRASARRVLVTIDVCTKRARARVREVARGPRRHARRRIPRAVGAARRHAATPEKKVRKRASASEAEASAHSAGCGTATSTTRAGWRVLTGRQFSLTRVIFREVCVWRLGIV